MVALIAAIIQLLTLVFKSWMEWDAQKKKDQADLRAGWKDAAKSGDLSTINAAIDRLRQ